MTILVSGSSVTTDAGDLLDGSILGADLEALLDQLHLPVDDGVAISCDVEHTMDVLLELFIPVRDEVGALHCASVSETLGVLTLSVKEPRRCPLVRLVDQLGVIDAQLTICLLGSMI